MKTEKLVQDSEWCWGRHEETQNRFPFLWVFHALSISFELSSFCGKWMLFVSDIFKQRTHNDFNSNFTDLSAPHRSFRALHIEVLVVFAVSFRSNYVEWELRALEQCKKNWMVKNRLESTNNNKKRKESYTEIIVSSFLPILSFIIRTGILFFIYRDSFEKGQERMVKLDGDRECLKWEKARWKIKS